MTSTSVATQTRVTVCVVVKDRIEMMRDCLDALAIQQQVDYEVVVIDNGSTDGTYEMALERADSFPVPMRVERVTGPLGGARQAAVDHADAAIVAFTDSDCVPARDWLAKLVEPFADETVDVVQGRTDPAVEPDGRWPKTIRIDGWSGRYETCNIAYRAGALRAAGGFDRSGEVGGRRHHRRLARAAPRPPPCLCPAGAGASRRHLSGSALASSLRPRPRDVAGPGE